MLKYFCGRPTKIYLHENLTHEYFSYTKVSQYTVCPNNNRPAVLVSTSTVCCGISENVPILNLELSRL